MTHSSIKNRLDDDGLIGLEQTFVCSPVIDSAVFTLSFTFLHLTTDDRVTMLNIKEDLEADLRLLESSISKLSTLHYNWLDE